MDEERILDILMKKNLDDNEKALYALAQKIEKEGKPTVASLLYAALIGYKLELVAFLLEMAIYPIMEAAKLAYDEMMNDISTRN